MLFEDTSKVDSRTIKVVDTIATTIIMINITIITITTPSTFIARKLKSDETTNPNRYNTIAITHSGPNNYNPTNRLPTSSLSQLLVQDD
jgi:hypothetical protein